MSFSSIGVNEQLNATLSGDAIIEHKGTFRLRHDTEIVIGHIQPQSTSKTTTQPLSPKFFPLQLLLVLQQEERNP
ncbi:hypothetical protein MTR_2g089330 [Medicago truncatula]|uniref:Uncharacterized protein n=1 Tax=Medicago truncatula TaxID=3880 RepID=G7IRL2_MEDTR|nr:hypothetical protein MTR_2g089330 [Medicago truncatula]